MAARNSSATNWKLSPRLTNCDFRLLPPRRGPKYAQHRPPLTRRHPGDADAGDGLAVVPAHPGEPAYERVVEVGGRRGGADAGLVVTAG